MKIIKSNKPCQVISFKRFYKNRIINKTNKKNKKIGIKLDTTFKKKQTLKSLPYTGNPTNSSKCAKKRARKLGRLSIFANYSAITKIYIECRNLNSKAGRHLYDVDHVIPFFAGGLHHEKNLQIIGVVEHREKTQIDIEKYEIWSNRSGE